MMDFSGPAIGPCFHCAGTGYSDYPSNRKPCPIPGHSEAMDRFIGWPCGGNASAMEEKGIPVVPLSASTRKA